MPQYDNQAEAIRNLQTYLRQLSYFDPSIPPPPVDGIFASDTTNALRAFQASRGMEQTGVADQLVWELLYAAYRASLAEQSSSLPMSLFPDLPRNQEYGPGAQGFVIAAAQFMLRELESKYGATDLPEINGRYDEETARAVRAFQEQNALQSTGLLDRATWNRIADQYNTLQGRYSRE